MSLVVAAAVFAVISCPNCRTRPLCRRGTLMTWSQGGHACSCMWAGLARRHLAHRRADLGAAQLLERQTQFHAGLCYHWRRVWALSSSALSSQ